ncbi:hypothetical protein CYMTET_12155 [Cymbomonas tetramitiformis]|uniref:Uncharacterized protein n=1 Tax=Cymbomonas tetramitiformis TaxID=36881 RepID=A0AAE0LCQ2_9CHLO|nr:hypothetical protein CYMTET_12155 [Cymbomonas tetramitiformis]
MHPATVQDEPPRACRSAVGCGVPPLGFGMPTMGAFAVLSLLCIYSFAGVVVFVHYGCHAHGSIGCGDAFASYCSALDWDTPSFFFTHEFADLVNVPGSGSGSGSRCATDRAA